MAKATGAEIFKFYTEGWPEGHHHDECDDDASDIEDKGKCLLDPAEKYELSMFGYVINDDTNAERTFQSVFLKWKKQQSVKMMLIQVPRDKESEFRQLLSDHPEFKIV